MTAHKERIEVEIAKLLSETQLLGSEVAHSYSLCLVVNLSMEGCTD